MGKHTTWGEIREARMQDPAVRAQYEKTRAELGTFWADVELGMQDPEFARAYVKTSLRIQAVDAAVNAAALNPADARRTTTRRRWTWRR